MSFVSNDPAGDGPIRPTLQNYSWRALARFPASVVSSVSDDPDGGWADTAHTTELQPCFETVQAEFRARAFLRLLRLFAAKPGPARFPIRDIRAIRG